MHVVVEAEAPVDELEEDLLKAVDVHQTLVANTILQEPFPDLASLSTLFLLEERSQVIVLLNLLSAVLNHDLVEYLNKRPAIIFIQRLYNACSAMLCTDLVAFSAEFVL